MKRHKSLKDLAGINRENYYNNYYKTQAYHIEQSYVKLLKGDELIKYLREREEEEFLDRL